MLLIKIAGGSVLVVLVLAYVLRGRSSGARSVARKSSRPTLPPSPYQPSRGFHLLDGEDLAPPPPVQLPRLDPLGEFVFNDNTLTEVTAPHLRHDEKWALDRSMRHAPAPRQRRRRRAVTTVVFVIVAAALAAVLWAGSQPASHHVGMPFFVVTPSSWMI